MGFLILCLVVAVILIAMRISTWSKARPNQRFIVVNTPEGGRKVIQSPPATGRSESRAPTQSRATAQARHPVQPVAKPQPQRQERAPAQPESTSPDAPMQQAGGSSSGVEAEAATEPLEPPSPLDMLSPKIAQVTPELAAQVVALMNKRQEVSAVRLLCDQLRIGILDAQKTARSLVGR